MGLAHLADDDFALLCDRVRMLSGVDLLQYKREQMERRVREWASRRGAASLAVYGDLLRRDPDELDAFLDRATINVSRLWRHEDQWEALRPLLATLVRGGRLRAWSAGCSHGAEAYTLAAICREALPGVEVDILGTDLDRRMIERARAGVFTGGDAHAPHEALTRHFEPLSGGVWRAGPALRERVRFEVGRPAARPGRSGRVLADPLPQHADLLRAGRARRTAPPARRLARPRRLSGDRNLRAHRRTRRAGPHGGRQLPLPQGLTHRPSRRDVRARTRRLQVRLHDR